MKRYRVTKDHEFLKEGVILDYNINNSLVHLFAVTEDMAKWQENGWIEEIQEPEFTRNDMVMFLEWFTANKPIAKDIIDIWIKETKR